MLKRIFPTIMAFVIALAFGHFVFAPALTEAAGTIGIFNVRPELRTKVIDYSCPAVTALAAGSVTAGTAGVVVVRAVTGVTSLAAATNTMTMPYPAKLKYLMIDTVGTNDSLACTVTVYGRDQFGNSINETVSANETEAKGAKVFEYIDSTLATGCTAGTDAGDVLRIRASNEVGLPYRIDSENALLSVCVYDLSAVNTLCYAASTFVADLTAESIDFDNGLVTLAISDRMIARVRPPSGR